MPPHLPQLVPPDSASALAERYDTIAYAAQAHAQTHPAQLATVATLLGLPSPPVATCRVLEVGCADGANLLPMAASLPLAQFTGCDLSAQAIARATRAAADLGLANVTLLQQDLRDLVDADGTFDYIVAHGVYSWVPAPVRDALLALAARRLAQNGVMFVSYNTFPGCHIRQAAWEILHAHVDALPTARQRLDEARALCALLAQPGATQTENDAFMRAEFGRLAVQSDSALYHDDLAVPNQPFWFHEFAAALAPHGLAYLGETKLSMMTPAGLSPQVAQFVAGMDRLAREQYLDYARMRRFRHSLVCRADAPAMSTDLETRLSSMHVAASITLVRAAAEDKTLLGPTMDATPEVRGNRALLQWLVDIAPDIVPVPAATAWQRQHAPASARSASAMLVDACYAGMVNLHVHPPSLASRDSARPRASAIVRWQVQRQASVTNLRHETLRIDDPLARRLLAALDGSRSHDELVALVADALPVAERDAAAARVATYLSHFTLHALLSA